MELSIEVVYARPREPAIVELKVQAGISLREAIERSGLLRRYPEIDLDHSRIGVFGELRRPDDRVKAGDRVEIYRPLSADPKEQRRRRATGIGD